MWEGVEHMNGGDRRWRMKTVKGRTAGWLLLGLVAVVLATLAAVGCGGDDEGGGAQETTTGDTGAAEGEAIKIGHLSTCEGPFAPFYDSTTAGAMLALVKRGAEPSGAKGSDGVSNAVVAGHPVELAWGCSDASPDRAVEEARRLVEEEGVDILIGPLSGSEGIAVANYAKDQPGVTFLNGSSAAQDTTLKVQAPNFFRFGTDGAQWMAGLGDYAYNELGWRKVVTIADDYDFPYTQNAGFVAEFCSLGGEVVSRIWPPLGEEDYSSYIAQIPSGDIDGFYLSVTGTGTIAFAKQYEQLKGNLADSIVAGSVAVDPNVLKELGDRMVGVVSAGPVAADSTDPAFTEYLDALKQAYPDVVGGSLFDVLYYDAMEAALLALEEVDGDLSDNHAAFREALAGLEVDFPNGTTRLDENQNAVAPNYLFEVVADETGDDIPDVKTLKEVPDVDQTFAGFFSADTPTPGREDPKCVQGNPPPWTSGG
jgi:branched-chain amino acid transport system substrate-binding protein